MKNSEKNELILLQRLTEAQRRRNERISHGALHFTAPPVHRFDDDGAHVWQTTTACDTLVRSAAAEECITLIVSPFPGRRSTVVFLPLDRPWDGDSCSTDKRAYVVPPSLSLVPPAHLAVRRTVPRAGAYATLRFVMPAAAVRFSGVMCTLERAGFTEEISLLSTSWSLKWCKHSVRSDFARLKTYQRINHFPGTWRIGKKDELHRHLVAARARWIERNHHHHNNNENSRLHPKDNDGDESFGDFFPEGWVLPDEYERLYHVLRSQEERGNVFIAKPATSACGKGIYLLRASEHPKLPGTGRQGNACNDIDDCSDINATQSFESSSSSSRRILVQRYVTDPLLIEGYKFDLRLYVVVTSYAPLRAYLYDEGLVRFATTPYPTTREEFADEDFVSDTALTMHLTNFTINKKSEDFVPPSAIPGSTRGDGPHASKWTLSSLQRYFVESGLDWDGTMAQVHNLLLKLLLAVEPHVVEELQNITASGGGIKGGCFEIYGVDVLLRQPQPLQECTPTPVIMEVNIMPSLSTHYSLLDQYVKGNFIADMLTLVGITAAGASKRPGRHAEPASQPLHGGGPFVSYGHAFLDALTDADELDACLTAEEELLRCTHFQRLCPTPHSYRRYRALFSTEGATRAFGDAPKRSLNEVLSAWEQAKLDDAPSWT